MVEFKFEKEVEKIDSVPKDFQGLYAQEGDSGPFKIRTDDAGVASAVSAITGMRVALSAARAEANGLKGKSVDLSGLAEYGEDPATILEGIKVALKDATKGKTAADIERQVEKIKKDLGATHTTDLEGKTKRIDALTSQLHGVMVINAAQAALAEAGAIDTALAIPFIERQVAVEEKDGKFTVLVRDAAEDTRYSGVTGAPMSIKELVAEMKADDKFGPLFKSEKKRGGGTEPETRRSVRTGDSGDLTAAQKISQGLRDR